MSKKALFRQILGNPLLIRSPLASVVGGSASWLLFCYP